MRATLRRIISIWLASVRPSIVASFTAQGSHHSLHSGQQSSLHPYSSRLSARSTEAYQNSWLGECGSQNSLPKTNVQDVESELPGSTPISISSISLGLTDLESTVTSVPSSPNVITVSQSSPAVLSEDVNLEAVGGFGICFDMIDDNGCKSPTTIAFQFANLARRGYRVVRIYDIGCYLGDYVKAAMDFGLHMMIGINGIVHLAEDLKTLIDMVSSVSWMPVESVYIGNELVQAGLATPREVADGVRTARTILAGAGFTGAVVTVETSGQVAAFPELCESSSFCAVNIHAFFDAEATAAVAGEVVRSSYQSVKDALSQKGLSQPIYIAESGWPWKGDANGNAVPSIENQRVALQSIMLEFQGDIGTSQVFLFQAYDTMYKPPGLFGVEPYFGIYEDSNKTS